MVPTPTRVQVRLSERRNRQRSFELREKEILDPRSIGEFPLAVSLDWFSTCFRCRRLGILDSHDALAIDEGRDVAALVPEAVAFFGHFVDDERSIALKNQRDVFRLSLSRDEPADHEEQGRGKLFPHG